MVSIIQMLEIEELKIYAIISIIFVFIYSLLYKYKGKDHTLYGYMSAISNSITHVICVVFIIVGVCLTLMIVEQGLKFFDISVLMLILVGWYMLILYWEKKIFLKDFGIKIDKIKIIKHIFIPYRCIIYIIQHLSFIWRYLGFVFGGLIFLLAYQCRENVFQAIGLIIVGIIFIMGNVTFSFIFERDKDIKEKEEVK